ncbi:hypothetical protein OH76DRAFT_1485638 [Lentinus brumalis]|uniref:Uncharacterized protein n=1 Tax=Lentinus brumalis TaxID=2498619 RepID=A0A371D119_9APHY|nr:hypothetical protein OH76DRAFT_1485638 [Polyporus brumalis]
MSSWPRQPSLRRWLTSCSCSIRRAGSTQATSPTNTTYSGSSNYDERIRREYEYKIATMQTRITGLERDLQDAQDREQKWMEGEQRVRAMEQELVELRRIAEEKTSSMLSLQQELDALREERARERDMAERQQRQDQEELEALRERCGILESGGGGGGVDSAILDQLRSDMEGLITELTELSRRND